MRLVELTFNPLTWANQPTFHSRNHSAHWLDSLNLSLCNTSQPGMEVNTEVRMTVSSISNVGHSPNASFRLRLLNLVLSSLTNDLNEAWLNTSPELGFVFPRSSISRVKLWTTKTPSVVCSVQRRLISRPVIMVSLLSTNPRS